jgi:hypothetical protein
MWCTQIVVLRFNALSRKGGRFCVTVHMPPHSTVFQKMIARIQIGGCQSIGLWKECATRSPHVTPPPRCGNFTTIRATFVHHVPPYLAACRKKSRIQDRSLSIYQTIWSTHTLEPPHATTRCHSCKLIF